jgi:hypothetical protein
MDWRDQDMSKKNKMRDKLKPRHDKNDEDKKIKNKIDVIGQKEGLPVFWLPPSLVWSSLV